MQLKELLDSKGTKYCFVAGLLKMDKSDFSKKLRTNRFTLLELTNLREKGVLTLEDIDIITQKK